MGRLLRLRVEIHDPAELSLHLPDGEIATVLGELNTANLTAIRAEIRADRGARLGGLDIRSVVVSPRLAGRSLMALQNGQSVIVMGSAIPVTDAKPINFIGEVFPL